MISPTPNTPKTAIITGAGSGIGRATALAFSAAGWNVALAGRRADKLQETLNLCVQTAPASKVLAVPTDVCDEANVQQLFAQAVQRFGRLDALFNNAGLNGMNMPTEDLSAENFRRIVDTNVTGMFLCLREAFVVYKAQFEKGEPAGRIINNGSISAHAPRPNSIAYTTTKHAVSGLTKSAALDGRKYGIAVGQIDVGNAMTELAARMATGVPQANGGVAIEPMMDAADVAQSVLYMANLPLSTNVLFHTVMATNMPFVGRG